MPLSPFANYPLALEVLRKFYEHRAESDYCPTGLDFHGVDLQTLYSVCELMEQQGLIRWWKAKTEPQIEGLAFGIGYISSTGILLMERFFD